MVFGDFFLFSGKMLQDTRQYNKKTEGRCNSDNLFHYFITFPDYSTFFYIFILF